MRSIMEGEARVAFVAAWLLSAWKPCESHETRLTGAEAETGVGATASLEIDWVSGYTIVRKWKP
jgi:hypothetical protein